MPQIIKNTFEGIEGIARSTVSQVKKLPMEMMRDAIASLGGQVTTVTQADQTEIKTKDKRDLMVARQNLASIIVELKQMKRDKPQEVQMDVKEQKKVLEKKKKESVLMKLIKSKQGSKEAMQRASG